MCHHLYPRKVKAGSLKSSGRYYIIHPSNIGWSSPDVLLYLHPGQCIRLVQHRHAGPLSRATSPCANHAAKRSARAALVCVRARRVRHVCRCRFSPRDTQCLALTGPPTLTAAQRTAHCSCRAGQVNVTTRWLAWLGVELDELVGDRRRREHAQVREQQRDVPCRAAREYTLQGLACPAP